MEPDAEEWHPPAVPRASEEALCLTQPLSNAATERDTSSEF